MRIPTRSLTAQVACRRASDVWLRDPEKARALLGGVPADRLDGPSLSLLSWLILTQDRDEKEAEAVARAALPRPGDTRFASAVLAEVLLRRGEYDEAIAVLEDVRRRFPDVPWYDLTVADALLEAGRVEIAEGILEKAAHHPKLRRHALKRLSRLALERGDDDRARGHFRSLVALAPDYLVYASDYVTLGNLELGAGDRRAARDAWCRGAQVYPRHPELRDLVAEHFGEHVEASPPKVPKVSEEDLAVRRIPVRTPIISWRVDMAGLIDDATAGVRRPGDVLALAESAAAAGQGRMLPLELVHPSRLATLLCRFVGERGPLHSPQGMQGAIMESGRLRVTAAAAAAAAGKLAGRKGWFYRVAGPPTAMIDDVAGCLPPHDHHVIFGPATADKLATGLSEALGCGVAIVDANHRSGAWVVGVSPDVDRAWLAGALADNPAGNEDEQTPVVVVRRLSPDRTPATSA